MVVRCGLRIIVRLCPCKKYGEEEGKHSHYILLGCVISSVEFSYPCPLHTILVKIATILSHINQDPFL